MNTKVLARLQLTHESRKAYSNSSVSGLLDGSWDLLVNQLAVELVSGALRRFPTDSGRWRFLPWGLKMCKRTFRDPAIRRIHTRHGFQMQVDVAEHLGRHVYVTGEYEPATTRLIKSLLRPRETFIDIGANRGFFTCLAAKLVGNGHVFSFEAMPQVFDALNENVQLNSFDNCSTFNIALSHENGKSTFYSGPTNHLGLSSLRAINGSHRTISVKTRKLDDVLPDLESISLVKIDVEGAECNVLEGMSETLERLRPDLILEITPDYLEELGRSSAMIEDILQPLGYRYFQIDDKELRPMSSLREPPAYQCNVYFTTDRERIARSSLLSTHPA